MKNANIVKMECISKRSRPRDRAAVHLKGKAMDFNQPNRVQGQML